jgi:tetratricopeptide (TPR) repeat protein
MARDMNDASVLLERGRRREELGDDPGALADFERAIEIALGARDSSTEVAARAGLVRLHVAAGHASDVDAQLDRIEVALAADGVASTARAEALSEWALVLTERGEDARALLGEALTLTTEAPAEGQARRVQVRALLYQAHADRLRGDYGAARATLERALAIAEDGLGRESQEAADILNGLGMLAKFSGDFDDAQRAYERAAEIVERRYGPEHPDMAAIYHNLAGLAHARGDFAAAEPLARRSVEIREAACGHDHLAAILDRAGLGAILSDLRRDEEAAVILEGVLRDLESTVGSAHREYAVTLNNLAAFDQRQGDLEAAERRYRQALEIKERTQGPEAPALATTLNNLATVLRRRGRSDEAREAYQRAIEILDGVVASDHPTLAAARRNVARMDDDR